MINWLPISGGICPFNVAPIISAPCSANAPRLRRFTGSDCAFKAGQTRSINIFPATTSPDFASSANLLIIPGISLVIALRKVAAVVSVPGFRPFGFPDCPGQSGHPQNFCKLPDPANSGL